MEGGENSPSKLEGVGGACVRPPQHQGTQLSAVAGLWVETLFFSVSQEK